MDSHGQAFAATSPTPRQNCPSTRSTHALAKPVLIAAFSIAGLKGSLHFTTFENESKRALFILKRIS